MKTIIVSPRSKSVESLLKKAKRNGLILKSSAGQRFVLAPINNWVGYNIGDSKDFAEEVAKTARNKKLMKDLAARRIAGKSIPLKEVRKHLGLG